MEITNPVLFEVLAARGRTSTITPGGARGDGPKRRPFLWAGARVPLASLRSSAPRSSSPPMESGVGAREVLGFGAMLLAIAVALWV